jgi:hypothetical protein
MPDHAGSATIECGGCNVGMIDDTVALVVEAWNRRAALAAPQQEPVAFLDGWKLVPIEPTDAMQAAGAQSIRLDTTAINKIWTGNKVFRAMIEAAPMAPPAAPVLSDEAVNAIMEQAQVFASAWSLVGGRFDFGGGLQVAEQEKTNLRALLNEVRP